MDNRNSEPATAIRLLAQSFPCLWNAPGVRPWMPLEFDDWASSGGPSHGEVCTARFLLAVWEPNNSWKAGRFDLMDSLRNWDPLHRHAFLEWASDPWWA